MTFPEIEIEGPGADQPDALQAPARRAGDRAGRRRRSGPTPPTRTASCIELGPDAEAENRLAKALWELGELGAAREHYQTALALDPTNRIAERNIDRLRMLLVEAGEKTVAGPGGQQGARQDLRRGDRQDRLRAPDRPADPRKLAQVNPGDCGRADARGQPPDRLQQRRPHRRRRAAGRGAAAQAHRRRQQVRGRRDVARRQGRPDHHPRDLPGPAELRQGLVPDGGQVDRPPAVHEGHARARGDGPRGGPRGRRGGRRDRGPRSRPAAPRSRPTRRSKRSPTSSRSRRPGHAPGRRVCVGRT